MLEIIYSLLFIEFLGILIFPIIFKIFWKLPDRGYAFTKLFSLVLWVYIIWLIGSLSGNLNVVLTSSIILTSIGLVSFITLYYNYKYILNYIKKQYVMIIAFDLCFLIIFASWILIRNFDPAIYHTEQIMDFTILHSVMNYTSYPPEDLWFSGNTINYYYYGYLVFGVLFDFLQIDASIAYNLTIPLIAALSSIILFGLIWNISSCLHFSKTIIFLLCSSSVIVFNFFSNTEPLFELLNTMTILPKEFLLWLAIDGLDVNVDGISFFPNDHYWWWRATRVINTFDSVTNSSLDYTITEFPFFTFALADLHPHLISIPFYLMFITFSFNLVLLNHGTNLIIGKKRISNNIFLLFLSLTFGSLIIMNAWNTPSIALLLFGASIIPIRNYLTPNLFTKVKINLYIIIFSILMYLPFFINYKAPVNEISVVGAISSQFIHLFTIWGLFLTIILVFLICIYARQCKYFLNTFVPNKTLSILPMILIIFIWLISIFLKETFNSNVLLVLINRNVTLLLFSIIFVLLTYLIISKNDIPITLTQKYITTHSVDTFYFVLTILLIGIVLIIIPEYFYIKDQFANRMNTVFKFSFQSWILLSIFAPLLIYFISTYIIRFKPSFFISLVFIVFIYLYYSFSFINLQFNSWDRTFNINVHKNFSVENKLTYDAIEWIKENLPQGSIILEASGDSYSNYSKISSFTGYPTVLGWVGHQRQWRPFQLEEISNREKDIENIYLSNNIDRVKQLINKYKIRYIYLGIQENTKYGKNSISNNTFRSFGKRIYQSDQEVNGNHIYIYDVSFIHE